MSDKPRFFYSESVIYGLTVYDRITHTPAFAYGASTHMKEFEAMLLCRKLNHLHNKGELDND